MLGKLHLTSKFMIRSCFMYGMNYAVHCHLMHTSDFNVRPVKHTPGNSSLHCVSRSESELVITKLYACGAFVTGLLPKCD